MDAPQDNFRQRVIHIIANIPYGHVVSYGQVARLAGSPRAARQVGAILNALPQDSSLPWYRVVNRYGKISLTGADFERQKQALLAEGVAFDDQSAINFAQYGWHW